MWKTRIGLPLSILSFGILLGLSIYYESMWYLYAASAMPLACAFLLPNATNHQYLRRTSRKVQFAKQSLGGEMVLSLTFPPGKIRWSCSQLYLPVRKLGAKLKAPAADSAAETGGANATLPVLPYDLLKHPSKSGWVGIDLPQLAERTRSLAYTTGDITRLVIRWSDLEAALQAEPAMSSSPASAGKRMQA